eukprot:431017_1
MNNDTLVEIDDINDNKDEDDDISDSIDKLINTHTNPDENTDIKLKNIDTVAIDTVPIDSLDETTKLHSKARSVMEGITPKEQKEIAADMFSQMKQLKATNDVMGYHGFSGLLQRHDSNMNITGNASPINKKMDSSDEFLTSHSKLNELKDDSDSYQDSELPIRNNCNEFNEFRNEFRSEFSSGRYNNNNNNINNISTDTDSNVNVSHKNIILSETKPLRQKLDKISMSINKIRQDLVNQNSQKNLFNNISTKQLNETVMFFQNQLTDIQDQIEDAENDIESNIDVKLLQYYEEIKLNKAKIKNMKKDKKEKEKQFAINKEKEQQKIIEMQRMQIQQLIRAQSETIKKIKENRQNTHQFSQTMSQINFHNQDHIINKVTKRKRRHSSGSLSLPPIDSENDYNMNDIQLATNNNLNIHINDSTNINSPYNDDDDMAMDDMQFPNINTSPYTGNNTVIHHHTPVNNEGQYYKYHNNHIQKQPPLLSDNAIKIIGGVAIFLSGIWIVSKYIDSKGNNMPSTNVYRGPRIKY